jgi:hypothetical protein
MKAKTYSATKIKRHLEQYKIATMEDLKKVLGTDVRMTVFRKLRELPFRTSYSHRGKYYALEKAIHFNDTGLWSSKSVWFSSYGTLLDTTKAFVIKSEMGYSAIELDYILHVSVRESLITLLKRRRVWRKKVAGVYVYFANSSDVQTKQVIRRREYLYDQNYKLGKVEEGLLHHELKAAIVLFSSILNEKQKRLYSGLESIKIGYGGDQIISELLGIDCHTVAKGRKEIMDYDLEVERVRKKGGGRSLIKKKPK